MKKKDKRKKTQQLKQEEIHQKNCYLKRIKAMMGVLGDESAYDCLGPIGVEYLYSIRLRPIKIISPETPNLKVSKHDLNIMNETLNQLLRGSFVCIGPKKTQVNLYDYFCLPETIFLYWRNVEKESCSNPEAFKEKFSFFRNDFEAIRHEAHLKREDCFRLISWIYTNMGKYIIRLESELSKIDTDSYNLKSFYNNYIVYFEKPKTELFEIDGHKRTIFQIGTYNGDQFTGITITSEQLGMNGILKHLPLKVYIQRHALERIKERIGDYFTGINYIEIMSAVLKYYTFPSDDGGFLFPYTFRNKRLGYLKADVIGDRMIIRTFLFLTNNGTPEGKKLANLLRVQKADKKYLGIDQLSTFIDSDIEANENLKRIFCQAGCGELFELKQIMKKNPTPSIHCANYLEYYLGLKGEEEVLTLKCD